MTRDFKGHKNYYEAGFAIGDLLAIYCFDTPNASLMELLADVPATYTDCGLKDQKIKITAVTLGATPTKGVKDSINVVGSLNEDVEMKSVDINVTLSGAPLHKESIPKTDIYS
jgi:hypothetical protein